MCGQASPHLIGLKYLVTQYTHYDWVDHIVRVHQKSSARKITYLSIPTLGGENLESLCNLGKDIKLVHP